MGPTYPAIHIGTRATAIVLTTWDVIDSLSRENASGIQFAAGALTGALLSAIVYNKYIPRENLGLAVRRNCFALALSGIMPSGLSQVSTWLSKEFLSSFISGFRGGFVDVQLIFPNMEGNAADFYSKGMWEWSPT